MQSIRLQGGSLFAADAASRGAGWRPSDAADVPGANLLKAGYALIAREPLLEVDIRPPAPSAEGARSLLPLLMPWRQWVGVTACSARAARAPLYHSYYAMTMHAGRPQHQRHAWVPGHALPGQHAVATEYFNSKHNSQLAVCWQALARSSWRCATSGCTPR